MTATPLLWRKRHKQKYEVYFGGYVKPANLKEHRIDRRFARNQNGKRKVVVIVRERGVGPAAASCGCAAAMSGRLDAVACAGTDPVTPLSGMLNGTSARARTAPEFD